MSRQNARLSARFAQFVLTYGQVNVLSFAFCEEMVREVQVAVNSV